MIGRLIKYGGFIFYRYILLSVELMIGEISAMYISFTIPHKRIFVRLKEGKEKEGELTSVHCPLVCTMSITQGSDLFSVSRSSRALQDTRSSTLETQVAGPLRLVAGEVAS